MAAGTARPNGDRGARPSTPPSRSWRDSSSTSGPAGTGPATPGRPVFPVRSTCWPGACPAPSAPGRWSTRVGPSSPFPPAGNTTSCEASTTSGMRAPSPRTVAGRRSSWWSASGGRTGAGRSRTPTGARSTSPWSPPPGSPAAGTPCGPCGCSARFEESHRPGEIPGGPSAAPGDSTARLAPWCSRVSWSSETETLRGVVPSRAASAAQAPAAWPVTIEVGITRYEEWAS